MNHDALFKLLLKNRSILRAFFEQFLPDVAGFMDFGRLEYVDKERLTLQGRKRTGDLLIQTKFRDQAACFLIHLEHQAQSDTNLAWRMLEYYVLDRQDFGLPVYPVAVLSHAKPAGKQSSPLRAQFPNKRVLEFDFDVIDLARLEARTFLQCHNLAALALAARMSFETKRRLTLARDFFVSLASTAAGRAEQELVTGFYSAYQPLSKEETLQLNRDLSIVMPEALREKVMQLTNPFIELGFQQGIEKGLAEGIEKGVEKGRREGEVELVLRQLSRRFGALPASQRKLIRKLDLAKIEALGESLLGLKSRSDLTRWLRTNGS